MFQNMLDQLFLSNKKYYFFSFVSGQIVNNHRKAMGAMIQVIKDTMAIAEKASPGKFSPGIVTPFCITTMAISALGIMLTPITMGSNMSISLQLDWRRRRLGRCGGTSPGRTIRSLIFRTVPWWLSVPRCSADPVGSGATATASTNACTNVSHCIRLDTPS